MATIEERFWAKVYFPPCEDDCWTWTAYSNRLGYGSFHPSPGTAAPAHRVAYEMVVGPVPDGLVIDHLCRNPSCVNPAHLEPVTQQENVRRGLKGQMVTHCPQGHEYNDATTYIDPRGRRHCRVCRRGRSKQRMDADYWRAYRAKRKAAGNPIPDYHQPGYQTERRALLKASTQEAAR